MVLNLENNEECLVQSGFKPFNKYSFQLPGQRHVKDALDFFHCYYLCMIEGWLCSAPYLYYMGKNSVGCLFLPTQTLLFLGRNAFRRTKRKHKSLLVYGSRDLSMSLKIFIYYLQYFIFPKNVQKSFLIILTQVFFLVFYHSFCTLLLWK